MEPAIAAVYLRSIQKVDSLYLMPLHQPKMSFNFQKARVGIFSPKNVKQKSAPTEKYSQRLQILPSWAAFN